MSVEIGDWVYCRRPRAGQRDIPGQMWLSGATVAYVTKAELTALAWFAHYPGARLTVEEIAPRVGKNLIWKSEMRRGLAKLVRRGWVALENGAYRHGNRRATAGQPQGNRRATAGQPPNG